MSATAVLTEACSFWLDAGESLDKRERMDKDGDADADADGRQKNNRRTRQGRVIKKGPVAKKDTLKHSARESERRSLHLSFFVNEDISPRNNSGQGANSEWRENARVVHTPQKARGGGILKADLAFTFKDVEVLTYEFKMTGTSKPVQNNTESKRYSARKVHP